MTCFILSALIGLATENCKINNAKFITVGFKDKETITFVCERPNGSFLVINNIGYISKKDTHVCLNK